MSFDRFMDFLLGPYISCEDEKRAKAYGIDPKKYSARKLKRILAEKEVEEKKAQEKAYDDWLHNSLPIDLEERFAYEEYCRGER